MRIFKVKQELELRHNDKLIGIYVPGLSYNCADDNTMLSAQLDQWVADGRAEVLQYQQQAQPAQLGGTGTVT